MDEIKPTPGLAELCECLNITNEGLRNIMKIYRRDLKLGLDEKSVDRSSLKCYITYVQDLPTGNEKGKFLAVDLAGMTFRVILINLAKKSFDLRAKMYSFTPHLITGSGTKLFNFIAECIYEFTVTNKINHDNLPLGFTFGFPLDQRGIDKGILKTWTKGFRCSGVEGKDVVALLESAIARKKDLRVNVCAVLNDTTGTLMSCAWKSKNCKIGLILGAGINICYLERVKRVKKPFAGDPSKDFVIVNTESGGFGGRGQIDFLRTRWDRELDSESANPGVNVCEKMISNLYLGEVVRRVLFTAAQRGIIFNGKVTPQLSTSGCFDTSLIAEIFEDLPGQYRSARAVLTDLGYPLPWAQDCLDLRYACQAVYKRAVGIVSAELAALLDYMNFRDVAIGVDGIMWRGHFSFPEYLNKTIRELIKPSITFRCILSEDGGGLGAALIAAVAAKKKKDK